jgi:ABC-type bacteriocin/lantibiotic exporter with double-glycine peptidase domain
LHVRTVAAIIVWFVVIILLLNRALRLDWITPISIVLTVAAVLIYFSPRFRKKKNQKEAL